MKRFWNWLKGHVYADYPEDEHDTMPDFHAGGMVGKGTTPPLILDRNEHDPMGKRSPMEQALHERNQRTVERIRKDYPLPVHKGAKPIALIIRDSDVERDLEAGRVVQEALQARANKRLGLTPEMVDAEDGLLAEIADVERLEHSDHMGKVEMVDITDARRNSFTMQHGGTHYVTMKMQPFQFTLANGWDGAAHTALKYVSRHATKAGRIDLEKAAHVLEIRRDSLPPKDLLTDGTMDVTPKRWANKPISIQTYIDVNGIGYPESEVLFALARWVWNPIDETVYEDLQTKLRGLIELRYPKL